MGASPLHVHFLNFLFSGMVFFRGPVYNEHEWTIEDLNRELNVKLDVREPHKSPGLTKEEAARYDGHCISWEGQLEASNHVSPTTLLHTYTYVSHAFSPFLFFPRRVQVYGKNALTPPKITPWFIKLLQKFIDPFMILLEVRRLYSS